MIVSVIIDNIPYRVESRGSVEMERLESGNVAFRGDPPIQVAVDEDKLAKIRASAKRHKLHVISDGWSTRGKERL